MALLFSAYVTLLAVVQRSLQFEAYGANLFEVILAYVAGGASAGAIIGVLRPFNESPWGRAFVGMLAAAPVLFGFFVLLEGWPAGWPSSYWIALAGGSAFVGPLTAYFSGK